ncbi:MAG: thioredoxin family protein, partial [Desulfobacterales bacterium]|nr:thioredoxin family protein [Desulfobacterales bacterium]
MLNAKLFGLIAIILLFSMTFSASAQPVEIRYFYQPGCYDCRLSEPIINQIEIQNNNITITKINVNT